VANELIPEVQTIIVMPDRATTAIAVFVPVHDVVFSNTNTVVSMARTATPENETVTLRVPQGLMISQHIGDGSIPADWTRPGHRFHGWRLNTSGDQPILNATQVGNTVVDGNMEFHAIWDDTFIFGATDLNFGTLQLAMSMITSDPIQLGDNLLVGATNPTDYVLQNIMGGGADGVTITVTASENGADNNLAPLLRYQNGTDDWRPVVNMHVINTAERPNITWGELGIGVNVGWAQLLGGDATYGATLTWTVVPNGL